MPNRIIKESICTSETLAQLSDFDFRLWVGLITQADDYGRGEARPAIVRGRVFPLRDDVTLADVEASMRKMAEVGAITLYKVAGKKYYCFPTWANHQNIRSKRSKYPSPDEADPEEDCDEDVTLADNLQTDASKCKQMQANDSICPRNPNPNPTRNPNPNPNPNPNLSRYPSAREDLFERFWSEYPRKVAKESARAEWALIAPDEALANRITSAVLTAMKSEQWRQDGGRFIPYPAKYLSEQRWNDEPVIKQYRDYAESNVDWENYKVVNPWEEESG